MRLKRIAQLLIKLLVTQLMELQNRVCSEMVTPEVLLMTVVVQWLMEALLWMLVVLVLIAAVRVRVEVVWWMRAWLKWCLRGL